MVEEEGGLTGNRGGWSGGLRRRPFHRTGPNVSSWLSRTSFTMRAVLLAGALVGEEVGKSAAPRGRPAMERGEGFVFGEDMVLGVDGGAKGSGET